MNTHRKPSEVLDNDLKIDAAYYAPDIPPQSAIDGISTCYVCGASLLYATVDGLVMCADGHEWSSGAAFLKRRGLILHRLYLGVKLLTLASIISIMIGVFSVRGEPLIVGIMLAVFGAVVCDAIWEIERSRP